MSLGVVGIDIWQPALALARANVALLPAPFVSRAVAEVALDRLVVALAPGGYLVVGLYLPPPGSLGAAFAALRLIRSGGHVWQSREDSRTAVRRASTPEAYRGPRISIRSRFRVTSAPNSASILCRSRALAVPTIPRPGRSRSGNQRLVSGTCARQRRSRWNGFWPTARAAADSNSVTPSGNRPVAPRQGPELV